MEPLLYSCTNHQINRKSSEEEGLSLANSVGFCDSVKTKEKVEEEHSAGQLIGGRCVGHSLGVSGGRVDFGYLLSLAP